MNFPRRGFTLIEVVAASSLLVVLLLSTVTVMRTVRESQRAIEQHACARREAGNAMERLAALNWEQLTTQRAADEQLSAAARDILTDAALKATVEPVAGDPTARRIRVEVYWRDPAGQRVNPVRLTSWKYQISPAK